MNRYYQLRQNRISILINCILLVALILFLKIFYVQIINHDYYATKIRNQINKTTNKKGSRGIIFDRNNIPLTQNINKYTLWINTLNNDSINKYYISKQFSSFFNKPINYYYSILNKNKSYNIIEKNISEIIYEQFKKLKNLKNINIEQKIRRKYPYSELASQLIGFTNVNNHGIIGIESKFNNLLSGESKKINLNHKKMIPINSNQTLPNKGSDIILTLDINLQTILQDELNNSLINTGAKTGNGVIVDPFSGEILAMATVPSLDLNNYQNYPIEYQQNKVISEMYEPGSTFKIVTMAAKLEMLDEYNNQVYNCENGSFHYMDKEFSDHEKHSLLNISDILSYSSNIGMIKIANEIGNKNIFHFTRQFGFGSSTGISLPNESYGIVNPLHIWSGISGPVISIGQEIAVNNLQLAMAYSAIANGGYLLKPTIIKNINYNDGSNYVNKIQIIRRCASNHSTSKITKMLESVINKGTGIAAQIPGFNIGGKTGTAQKIIDGKYSISNFVSSFAAIFPIDNPKYVCIVSIDSPDYQLGYHWASETAAPIVKKIIKKIILSDKNNTNYYANEYQINSNNEKNSSEFIFRKLWN